MTVEFFDLAQRLYAAENGAPVLRLARPLFAVAEAAVFVDVDSVNPLVATVCGPDRVACSAAGAREVLAAVHAAGGRFGGAAPCQLVVAENAALGTLAAAARAVRSDPDATVAEAAAVMGWWIDRSGYPGSGVVVELAGQSRQRFVTGAVPAAERAVAHWRAVFAVPSGVAGLVDWAAAISVGQVPGSLAPVHEEDAFTYGLAGQRFADGADWAAPDSAPGAALGLRRRCDAAELFEAVLLEDRLWRQRGVHTGSVSGGPVTSTFGTKFVVECQRMDSRLRVGSKVQGWQGGLDSFDRAQTFFGEVTDTEALDSVLHLTVGGVRAESRPVEGNWVSLMPAAPVAQRVASAFHQYRRLLTTRDCWLTTGKTPGRFTREVPLDVLIAAATDD